MRSLMLLSLALVGCGGAPADIHGPYTGVTRRFAISSVVLPMSREDFSADLAGNGRPYNALGELIGALVGQGDNIIEQHVDQVLATNPPLVVELVSDDPSLREDPTVGVRIDGGDQLGAVLHDGELRSNRVSPRHREAATLAVPLFDHAAASPIALDHWQLDLVPDGEGGFFGNLDGAIPAGAVIDELAPAFLQMLASGPHPLLVRALDADHDGTVSLDELRRNGVVQEMTAPDVALDGAMRDHFSIGLSLALTPLP